jgi:SET domain
MPKSLPHVGVFVRLGVSPIHGIGVFAQQPIKTGTNVFPNDTREISWVPRSLLTDQSLAVFQRRFYEDFAIRRGDELGCPANFNLLTVGWYVNEPPDGVEPNLVPTESFDLIAARDIAAGEELTIRYASFVEKTVARSPLST